MSHMKFLSVSLSALALGAAAPALADVTAAELWAEWQSQGAASGQILAAEEVEETETGLILRGFTSTTVQEEVTVTGRAEAITLTENDDGSVSVEMSETYDVFIQFDGSPGAPEGISVTMRHEDLEILADGTVDARSYVYEADRISIGEVEIVSDDPDQPIISAAIQMEDLRANYLIDGTDMDDLSITSSGEISDFYGTLDVIPPPSEQGRLKFSFSIGDLSSSAGGSLGNLAELAENPEVLPEDFDLSALLDYGRISFEVDFDDGAQAFQMFYSNTGGSFGMDFDEERFSYNVSAQGANARIAGSEIPIPINASVGNAELVIDLPIAATDEPEDFALRFAYENIVANEEVWALADPTQAIPRDPISVVVDISGAVRLLMSLMEIDPDDVSDVSENPAEIRSATINEFRLAAGGAELTATGDLTFAPGQEVPMPVGDIEINLDGGMALLDQLQSTGIVPIEQIAVVRGVLGAFARPGATPDTLETTVEFSEGGGITANGVPLQ